MSQPPGSPPGDWEKRRDETTRRLVTGFQEELSEARKEAAETRASLKQLGEDVASMDVNLQLLGERVKHSVSYQALIPLLALLLGACWALVAKFEATSKTEMRGAVGDVAQRFEEALEKKLNEKLPAPVADDVAPAKPAKTRKRRAPE